MRAHLIALALALLLAAPALAHFPDARPALQSGERQRIVGMRADGLNATVDLTQSTDQLRNFIQHELDPAKGRFSVEHRYDTSDSARSFRATWELERLVEYRDLNADGLYQAGQDTPVKSWRLAHYSWVALPITDVAVADVTGKGIAWTANVSGGPKLRLDAVAAGSEFTDEGARARPQDVILYFDFTALPPRAVGSLYAFEGSIHAPTGTTPVLHETENTTTAAYVDQGDRRALFVWGGEAVVDGREEVVPATIDEPIAEGTNARTPFHLHIPLADKGLRFVIVTGMEYAISTERAPGLGVAAIVGAIVLALPLRPRRP